MGATQNQNESFNNLIRLRASKTQMLSATTVELAVNIAVLVNNKGKEMGMKDLFTALGMECTLRSTEYYKQVDRLRLYKSEKSQLRCKRGGRRKLEIGQLQRKRYIRGRTYIWFWLSSKP